MFRSQTVRSRRSSQGSNLCEDGINAPEEYADTVVSWLQLERFVVSNWHFL